MAYQLNYFAAAYPAGNYDFSAVTGPIFVKLDSTSRVVPANATLPIKIEGILENAPPIGNVCTVSYMGVTKVMVDGAYSVGQPLTSDATGVGTATDATGTYARAMVLEPSSSGFDIVTVRLIDQPAY